MSAPIPVINDLANEILSSIFTQAACSRDCREMEFSDPLCTIALVCAKWYHVAVGTPSLWTHIDLFHPDYYSGKNVRWILTRARRWLERSKGCPLEIHVNETMPASLVNEAFELIEPHVRLIRSIRMANCTPFDTEPSLGLFRSLLSTHRVLGNLTSYLLTISHYGDLDPVPIFGSDIRPYRLKEFELFCGTTSPHLLLADIMTALTHCPELLVLRLIFDHTQGGFESSTKVHLSALKLLQLSSPNEALVASIARHLIPGKQELSVMICPPILHVKEVLDLLARSNVIALIFWGFGRLPADDFNRYVTCVPHLRALALNYTRCFTDSPSLQQFLAAMNHETRRLLPSFQAISIEYCHIQGPAMTALGEISDRLRLRFMGFRGCRFELEYDNEHNQQQSRMAEVTPGSTDVIPHPPPELQGCEERPPCTMVSINNEPLRRRNKLNTRTEHWLSSRFEEVIIEGGSIYQRGEGEDPYLERLIQVA